MDERKPSKIRLSVCIAGGRTERNENNLVTCIEQQIPLGKAHRCK